GYAIEAGGLQMTVNNNIMVGDWVAGAVSSRLNVAASNNSKYGPANWGDYIGEPSVDGYGTLILTNDSVDRDVSDAPAVPQLSDPQYKYNPKIDGTPAAQLPTITPGSGVSGSTSSGSTTTVGGWSSSSGSSSNGSSGNSGSGSSSDGSGDSGTVAVNTGVTNTGVTVTGTPLEIDPSALSTRPSGTLGTLTVVPLTATSARLTWSNPHIAGSGNNAPTVLKTEVDLVSTVGREHFPSVVYNADLSSATLVNLHPGWRIDFTVTLFTSDGRIFRAGPVQGFFTGNSVAPWSGVLWGGINRVQTIAALSSGG
ncbi:MAG: hypothetical protein JO353_13130, partial [Phycisphaerae bacterium]|nr:hypothetical protein [Phycisphaerae bacterium]